MSHQVNVSAGKECMISPAATLENVMLGDRVVIRGGAQLKNVIVGEATRISSNVRFYSPLKSRPVRLGGHCWFSFEVFGEATGGEILIGDFVVIAHRTTILTSSGPGSGSPIMNQLYPEKLDSVIIAAHSWIGASCTLLPGCSFEEGVVLGAHSLAVSGKFNRWSVYGGSPAKLLKQLTPEQVEEARRKLR